MNIEKKDFEQIYRVKCQADLLFKDLQKHITTLKEAQEFIKDYNSKISLDLWRAERDLETFNTLVGRIYGEAKEKNEG